MTFTRLAFAIVSATCFASTAFAQADAHAPAKPTAAPAAGANATVTRDQIPALVKEALINDPSILTDAIQKLHEKQDQDIKKQASAAIEKHKDDLFNDASAPSVGDAKTADVTLVEFFDYHCGYCKQVLPAITQLINEDKKVRIIFKEYPILSEDSVTASRAALAVNRIAKDKYFEFHTALFETKGKFDEKAIMEIAKKIGVDGAKLKTEMAKPDLDSILDKNREVGTDIGIHGTPAIVIGSEFFPGAMSLDELKKAVEAARAATGSKKADNAKPSVPAAAPAAKAPAAAVPPVPAPVPVDAAAAVVPVAPPAPTAAPIPAPAPVDAAAAPAPKP